MLLTPGAPENHTPCQQSVCQQANLPSWAPADTKVVFFGMYSDGSQVASIGTPFEFHPVMAFLLLDDISQGRRQLSYKRVGYIQKTADKSLPPDLLGLDECASTALSHAAPGACPVCLLGTCCLALPRASLRPG